MCVYVCDGGDSKENGVWGCTDYDLSIIVAIYLGRRRC